MATTLFDKLWAAHQITALTTGEDLLAIDRVFLHERTGAAALTSLESAGRRPIAPQRVFCTMDHIVSNAPGRGLNDARSPTGGAFIKATRNAAHEAGVHLIDVVDKRQGIVHVIAPELGVALPGLSLICPDSHTCSLGALGALAWGVGSSDAEHAIATGALRVAKPKQMRIEVKGALAADVTAKDVALHLISKFGADGAGRHAVEFCGSAIEAMSLEARLTLCNMAVEFSAFTAVIAPDDKVFEAIEGTPFAPAANDWTHALNDWRALKSDADAVFDAEVILNGADIRPSVSWGTSPEQAVPCDGLIPTLADIPEPRRDLAERAMAYMDIEPGQPLNALQIDGAFIGSCTNGRLTDLRAAAAQLKDRRIASGVKAVCVPGSNAVKRAAECEGLDKIFIAAGFDWGEPGCAMCFYAGGDTFAPGDRVISSTNRNFEGRQGPGVRTHLASPATVAASAVAGRIVPAVSRTSISEAI